MGLDSAEADVELVGYLGVGATPGDGEQDFFLTVGEWPFRLDGHRLGGRVGERREEPSGDAGGNEGVAVGRRVDCLYEKFGTGVFQQEPAGACLEGTVDVLVEVEGGDDDDRHWVIDIGAGERTGSFEAVHFGHADVEQAYVRVKFAGEGNGFSSVCRLPRRSSRHAALKFVLGLVDRSG